MKFDKDKLKAIEMLGMSGKSTALIARDLGMSFTDLEELRKSNKDLDNALTLSEKNYEAVAKAKLTADALSGKNNALAVKYFELLYEKDISQNKDLPPILKPLEIEANNGSDKDSEID